MMMLVTYLLTKIGDYMARTFIDVDQSDYISLGGGLGAYGVHKNLLSTADISILDADELNKVAPMIHFNRYHQNEDGVPSGVARVLQVLWAAPKRTGRGKKPYVRLRELPFGAVGNAQTSRKRYTPEEVIAYLKSHSL